MSVTCNTLMHRSTCCSKQCWCTCTNFQMRLEALWWHLVRKDDIAQPILQLALHKVLVLLQLGIQQALQIQLLSFLHLCRNAGDNSLFLRSLFDHQRVTVRLICMDAYSELTNVAVATVLLPLPLQATNVIPNAPQPWELFQLRCWALLRCDDCLRQEQEEHWHAKRAGTNCAPLFAGISCASTSNFTVVSRSMT